MFRFWVWVVLSFFVLTLAAGCVSLPVGPGPGVTGKTGIILSIPVPERVWEKVAEMQAQAAPAAQTEEAGTMQINICKKPAQDDCMVHLFIVSSGQETIEEEIETKPGAYEVNAKFTVNDRLLYESVKPVTVIVNAGEMATAPLQMRLVKGGISIIIDWE